MFQMSDFEDLADEGKYDEAIAEIFTNTNKHNRIKINSLTQTSMLSLHFTIIFLIKIKTGFEGKKNKYLKPHVLDKGSATYDKLFLCRYVYF